MPFKLNQHRRRHTPKQKHRVTNSLGALLRSWRAYDASLRQRGSLTAWFTNEAIEDWRAAPRTTPGGQPWYSSPAILTALPLRAVFRLALRQTVGLIGSVIGLLGLDLAAPNYSHALPPGADAGGAAPATAPRRRAPALAGGQHGPEALRHRRVAG